MNAARTLGQGIAFPPRVGADGRVCWSDGEENIRESIRIILLTERRERVMLPEFGGGLRTFLFEPNTTATRHLIADRIEKAVARWEPRVAVESVDVQPVEGDPQSAAAVITYRLVATGARERVGLTVSLGS